MHCPKCGKDKKVKNGIKYGKQRYKCKGCGCHFTQSKLRGASLETRLQALGLYLEGMGFRAIGRTMGVSNTTVLNWIRTLGQVIKRHIDSNLADDIRHVDFIEIDEMWHFVSKKNESSGSGSLSIVIPRKYLGSPSEVEVERLTKL